MKKTLFTSAKVLGVGLGILGGALALLGDVGDLKDAIDEHKEAKADEEKPKYILLETSEEA